MLGSAVLAALLGACAHDRVVLTAAEGPAPARVERPGLLRAHLRSRARALRRAPPGPPLFLPSGMPDIQRPHPEWTGPDHAHELPGTIKRLGEHLVLLHGSKLLVVSLADLRLRAAHDLGHAFQPAMFVHRDQVLVILRHLDRRRLRHEVRRFKIAGDGALTRLRSVHLRSDVRGLTGDARLAGDALVLHIQGALGRRTPDLLGLPAIRRAGRWRPLVRAADLQRPIVPAGDVHLRIRCPIADTMDCTAIGVVAPSAVFVTTDADAVYVWTRRELHRLPFADAPVTAVRVPGQPLDLLAWRLRDGDLDAAVRTDTGLAVVHLPAALLRAGLATARAEHVRPLAQLGDSDDVPVRFIGDHLLQADAPDWACHGDARLRVHSLTTGSATDLTLPHCISRIEPAGPHALVLAADENDPTHTVRLTAIDLTTPALGDTRTFTDVASGWLRTSGPHPLPAAPMSTTSIRVGLPHHDDAPLRVLTIDGPRIAETSAAGRGAGEHAFTVDGRIYVVRGDHLVELAEDTLEIRRSLALGER